MYAVIVTGGKQYKVAAGEKIKVEQLSGDVGSQVILDQVLAVGSGADLNVGTPTVAGATVTATVVAQAESGSQGPCSLETSRATKASSSAGSSISAMSSTTSAPASTGDSASGTDVPAGSATHREKKPTMGTTGHKLKESGKRSRKKEGDTSPLEKLK